MTKHPDISGVLYTLMIGVIIAFWAGVLVAAVAFTIDSITAPPPTCMPARVVDKENKPAYYTTDWETVGDTRIPITRYHPPKYYLDLNIDGERAKASVSEAIFINAQLDGWVNASVTDGRLSRYVHVGCEGE